jgi:hypothetical protein
MGQPVKAGIEGAYVEKGLNWPIGVQGQDWGPYVVTDGKLITGQNPKVPHPVSTLLSRQP